MLISPVITTQYTGTSALHWGQFFLIGGIWQSLEIFVMSQPDAGELLVMSSGE